MQDDFLTQIQKPGRYIGQEWNVSRKDFTKAEVRFALGFSDLYEVGMSNLGIRILYSLLNSIPDVACERFFSVADDLKQKLTGEGREIFSLESKRPLREFDFVGFSLGSELCFSNILGLLDLAKIPLTATARDNTFPLVIGGGPCTLNPEPLHEFFDLFLIGEAEEAITKLIDAWRKYKADYKSGKLTKEGLLLEFSRIKGVYVPMFYKVRYDSSGAVEEFKPAIASAPERIEKIFVRDLDNSYFPVEWLVPYIQIVHDRITLEIMRGCPNKCRFCQARSQYYPLRQRSVSRVLELAKSCYANSGYEEISLGGLSVSDYSKMNELLPKLVDFFKPYAVGVSLPSLKAKTVVGELSALIATIKKTGLTFAPEAGSQKLRDFLAKDFDESEYFAALAQAYQSGYQHVKLYFMIGLPGETNEDLDALVDFCVRTSELRRKISRFPAQVNISVNAMIPKPHTALQWCPMEHQESLKNKCEYLKEKIKKHKRLRINFHNLNMSFIEAVFSRGDRRLSKVLLYAYQRGAQFDAWEDYFNMQAWTEAFDQAGINPRQYLEPRQQQEFLPWDFIDAGIPKSLLLEEYKKSVA
jgi:radical SAM family uncharacterized protein